MRHPQHPVHHGRAGSGGGAGGGGGGGHQNLHHRSRSGAPPPKKPRPPSKAHKKPKPAKKPKKPPAKKPVRKWSPGWDADCCSAQALGTLLRLSDADVLGLYWATASTPDAGASIADTLAAAGLGSGRRHRGLILGVTLPEPHAVAVTPDGRWWSWGELFDPDDWPELVIDEAWAVLL